MLRVTFHVLSAHRIGAVAGCVAGFIFLYFAASSGLPRPSYSIVISVVAWSIRCSFAAGSVSAVAVSRIFLALGSAWVYWPDWISASASWASASCASGSLIWV